jgi:hypothetical protein
MIVPALVPRLGLEHGTSGTGFPPVAGPKTRKARLEAGLFDLRLKAKANG